MTGPAHYAKAEEHLAAAAAIEQYQACSQLDPRNPAFYARLGHLYYDDKQWDDAARQFQSARALETQDPTNYYYLARIAEARDDWVSAPTLPSHCLSAAPSGNALPFGSVVWMTPEMSLLYPSLAARPTVVQSATFANCGYGVPGALLLTRKPPATAPKRIAK